MANKMTTQEKADWTELCDYVKYTVLGYDYNQKFPRSLALRLKGLAQGKFMANNYIQSEANYSFRTIINTFKICRLSIQTGFSKNTFKNETHRINYMMVIIENNINDVYLKEKKLGMVDKKIERVDSNSISESDNVQSNYKTKTQLKKNIDDLL